MLLNGYAFDDEAVTVYTAARLRRRRIHWTEIEHFDVRGYRHGAGAWLIDKQWVRLRPGSGFYREKSASEVSRLETARQMMPQIN